LWRIRERRRMKDRAERIDENGERKEQK